MTTTCTTCPYCGVGCGVLATPDGQGGATIGGDPDHPASLGRLCSKGMALGETIGLEGRLLTPRIGGEDADWDTATALIATRFSEAIRDHGPDSVAFYVSGQLLTEDYYVANKLMKGFIGSANIDTNSRLCMASSVAGHKRAFGSDTVPGTYEDLEEADLVVLVGSNLAWCHPVLYQRIAAAKAARPGMRVVNIDPRATATNDLADLHLALEPGSDVALFNSLLVHLADGGHLDTAFEAHLTGLDEAVASARQDNAAATGLTAAQLGEFHRLWAGTRKVVTLYSQGVNQSSSGSDKVNAILNCHLATGRIGRPGMGPFSATGQPNAMGGREVGGLANMLACHLDIENPDHRTAVQGFWQSPVIAERQGLKAVNMFRACADGRIKALWIMSTNPAVSMPEADAVRDAIAACDFTVVSDIVADTDTARLADVLLPATGWGEKSGTVTNSDRTISRQRAFLPAPGGARPDWQAICDVAGAMGWRTAFDFTSPAEIFREHAALSGVAGAMGRDFDISGLSGMDDAAYDTLKPTRWPVTEAQAGGRFFTDGRFFTPDGKARMLAVATRPMATPTTPAFPFRLNTGRVRDHWHTMTRTARTPRLSRHIAEPFAEIHPSDAARLGIEAADLVTISSTKGRAVVRALVTDRTRPGTVFAPMHWTAEFSSEGRIDAVIASAVDPVSGQPELKGAAVAVTPYPARWYAFAASTARIMPEALPQRAYWALARTATGWQAELAGETEPPDWSQFTSDLLGLEGPLDAVIVEDASGRTYRAAFFAGDRPLGAIFVASRPVEVARGFVSDALDTGIPPQELIAGRPALDRPDRGAVVCSCYHVGINTIRAVIAEGGLATVDQIGAAVEAGTNCGSCRPELQRLLVERPLDLAAE